jgi:hypothetical protein
MDCPECGGRLTDYRLGDRGAVGCEDCGYVGIDAEHRGESTERETWADAMRRFHEREADAPAEDGRAELAVDDRSTDLAVESEESTDLAVPASDPTDGSVTGERTEESRR